ncbi:hypothetical protein [Flavobacterium denitrificans]|uniref:hypothetical protein n=1 Tax=Flavobacterium denitrificans TaxID=281361 RepID=UPI00047E8397|nr:hypothetical protein [Flavobacterium denitrificans]
MNRIESPMTNLEIEIIKTKVFKMKVFILVFLAFLIFWAWGLSDNDEIFTFLNGIILCVLILFSIFVVLALKKLWLTKNDIKSKIKILDELLVIEKHTTGTDNKRYTLQLDSDDIHRYIITKKAYDEISIGDTIKIEYSKCAFWILKIEHNGVSIENKNMIA